MIKFKSVKFKNFLSTGNTPIEIELDKHHSTLIIGDNGSGKSTMLDALTFGLFGKPFRKINKDQLVNSVNGSDCRVDVEFSIGRKKYHIVRSIKPNKCEIYMNNKLIDQDASVRDYQRHLENNILKLNYRSFTQVVILGSSSFVPFMQLTPSHRREVVEDILDIKIFSMMNVLLKQRRKELKIRQQEITYEYELLISKIQLTQDHITKTKEKGKTSLISLEKKLEKNQLEYDKIKKEASDLKAKFNDWNTNIKPKQEKLDEDKQKMSSFKWKLQDKASKARQEIEFFEKNDECPTCEQHIDEEFKKQAIEDRNVKLTVNDIALGELVAQVSEMEDRSKLYEDIRKDARDWEVEAAKKTSSSNSIINFSDELVEQMDSIKNVDGELSEDKTKLKTYKEEMTTVEKEKNKMTEDDNYFTIAKQLLQDSGIKTKIIKKYLPIMNQLINGYLNKLEFQVKFNLDEQFNETIQSRFRDVFGYANFSEGEKMRIDLALLFTWRQIAKMKNSTNTNLLILDEIFDSSLDANGTEEFLRILDTLSNENVFLVSHKTDLSIDKFEHMIMFRKEGNFTQVVS